MIRKLWFVVIFSFACSVFRLPAQDVMNQMLAEGPAITITSDELTWAPLDPSLPTRSPEISFLMTKSRNNIGMTQAYIRFPSGSILSKHMHSASETLVVISGQLHSVCQEEDEILKPGTFKFYPPLVLHELRTDPGETAMILVTLDSDWDVTFADKNS